MTKFPVVSTVVVSNVHQAIPLCHLAHELKEKLEGRRGFGRPMLSSLGSTWEVDPQALV